MTIEKAGQMPRWKRALDLSCIVATSPVWLLLMLVIAVWTKAVSRGPVFFRQERVGYKGRRFYCLKFRSMKTDADTKVHEKYFRDLIASDAPMVKMDSKGDSRLIFGGKLIRATGLDELPQLFNVLRGEMSLVGPRPCTPAEFREYQPHHRERVNAPPGLTGFWQVNGKNRTTFSEMIEMDVFYGKNMCISLDIAIIWKTVPALVGQARETRRSKSAGKRESYIRILEREDVQRIASGLHRVR